VSAAVPAGRRKLIEVSVPVAEISKASMADKLRSVGTIKNLHKWFAPMPSPAMRALIFASLVDDPGDEVARKDLLELVKRLVPENGTPPDAETLREASALIRASNPVLPTLVDPFAGGGSTIIEAQRLGLPAVGSDLNPVAALITRTLGELLPPLAHAPAVSTGGEATQLVQEPFAGLSEDLRHYGRLVEAAVKRRLGSAYALPPRGQPVAWLWARTVPCANPACGLAVPLFSSPWLSRQPGREATVEAVVDRGRVRFVVHHGAHGPAPSTKVEGARARFQCPGCGTYLGERDLRAAGTARPSRIGRQLMAVCIDTPEGRTFLSPEEAGQAGAEVTPPDDLDEIEIDGNRKAFSPPAYGLTRHLDLHTPRQLAILAAFADEVAKVLDQVIADGGGKEYARAVASILGLCVGKLVQTNSTLVRWYVRVGPSRAMPAFGTQTIPILWDFAEAYPFGKSVGCWTTQVESVIGSLNVLPKDVPPARVMQTDARRAGDLVPPGTALLVTDPPYFAQINYAGLSDHFYPWLRRALGGVHPDLFATIETPKSAELVADPARHGGSKAEARQYFISGFTEVFSSLLRASRPDLPMVVVYAHKQDEVEADGVVSTGWESLLEAVLMAGMGVVGTWPVEATAKTRQRGQDSNALASYVILVCRPRRVVAESTDRRGFLSALREELPGRLRELQSASIPPGDLGQAAIGPGMAVFSRYARVTEPDGRLMPVRTALALIHRVLAEVLYAQEGDLDGDSRWCVRWFDEHGFEPGDYARAEQHAWTYNTSMDGLERAGVLRKRAGKVVLLKPEELRGDYALASDNRRTVWEAVLHLSSALEDRGVPAAAQLMARMSGVLDLDAVKELAYLLYTICERRKRQDVALRFNGLVTSWPDITDAVRSGAVTQADDQLVIDYDAG
jgi:putative DNA methylase